MKKYVLTIVVQTEDDFSGNFMLLNHDVIDGFELTREGDNLTDDFQLKDAHIEKVMLSMDNAKVNQIQEIRRILRLWGPTSTAELELDHSPCLKNMGDNIVELIEKFDASGVTTVVYHDEVELDENYYLYDELPEDVLEEVYEIMAQHDAEMCKTMDRCRD